MNVRAISGALMRGAVLAGLVLAAVAAATIAAAAPDGNNGADAESRL